MTRTASSVGTEAEGRSAQNPVDRQVVVPRDPTDEMLRVSLAIDFPATYRDHLRHPMNGEKTARETEKAIEKERRRWSAMLSAAPIADLEQVTRERDEAVRLLGLWIEAGNNDAVIWKATKATAPFLASLRSMEKTGG